MTALLLSDRHRCALQCSRAPSNALCTSHTPSTHTSHAVRLGPCGSRNHMETVCGGKRGQERRPGTRVSHQGHSPGQPTIVRHRKRVTSVRDRAILAGPQTPITLHPVRERSSPYAPFYTPGTTATVAPQPRCDSALEGPERLPRRVAIHCQCDAGVSSVCSRAGRATRRQLAARIVRRMRSTRNRRCAPVCWVHMCLRTREESTIMLWGCHCLDGLGGMASE
jgi:hypothetical protein